MKYILLILSLSSMWACQRSELSKLSTEDKEAIKATSAKWLAAAKIGDWKTVVETYTEDAVLWYQNEDDIIGKDALLTYFKSQSPMSIINLHLDEIEGSGDLAFVSGTVTVTLEDGNTLTVAKYLDIRKKQKDGSWLYYRDMVIEPSEPEN